MEHLSEHINRRLQEEAINEHADSQYKTIFGHTISFSPSIKNKIIKVGLDFRHMYDNFVLYEDGCLEYTNPQLFVGTICAKLYKDKINRYIGPDGRKYLKIYTDNATIDKTFDLNDNPFNYFRAILNALTHKDYRVDLGNIILTGIDYTSGDFGSDSKNDVI